MRWIDLRSLPALLGGIALLGFFEQCSLPPSTSQRPATDEAATILSGLENLILNHQHLISGKRVGIVTNHTGAGRNGTPIWRLLDDLPDVDVAAVFSPEHGLFGEAAAGEKVDYGGHKAELPPIHSLYGATRKPTPEMLEGIDLMVYDIQDVGARFYTYISTMGLVMEAAAEADLPIIILDRPNPLSGNLVTGPILNPDFRSFVGYYPIPSVYGLTPGELALMISDHLWIDHSPKIEVIPMLGWKREMWYDGTGLPWIPPSPNIPDLETAIVYPATVLLEATNVSEGRGTDRPFRWIGAPWIDGAQLSKAMNETGMTGVQFRPIEFTPRSIAGSAPKPKYENVACGGVEIVVTDRSSFSPVMMGIELLLTISVLYTQELEVRESGLNRLFGSDLFTEVLDERLERRILLEKMKTGVDDFKSMRRSYLLYE